MRVKKLWFINICLRHFRTNNTGGLYGIHTADAEIADAKMAILYNLRLQIVKDTKEAYTKDEILRLLDTVAKDIKGGI